MVGSAFAQADDAVKRDDAVRTVSYSTEQSSGKLKWLPYRGSKVIADSQVVPATEVVVVAEGTKSAPGVAVLHLAPDMTKAAQPALEKGEPKSAESKSGDLKSGDRFPGLKPVESPPLRLGEPFGDKELQKPAFGPAPGTLLPQPRGEEVTPRLRSQNEGPSIPPLAAKPIEESCPTLEQLNLKPIQQITNDIAPKGDKFPFECPLKRETYEPRSWPALTYTWKASGLCHKPLYFEEVHLERYGHSLPPYVQPIASAAHFFLVIPALPYFMGVYPPDECVYTLGYYRPGSCAPYMLDPFPLSVRGALFEAGAWTGAVFALP